MAKSFLRQVIKQKQAEVEKAKKTMPFEKLLQIVLTRPPVRNYREAIFNAQRIGVIAEIKKKVPGTPSWKPRIQLEKLVKAYENGGALGLSVVTDARHFGGKLSLIEEVKRITHLPVLRKDFIVDPYQIYESRAAQADAVLILAEAVPNKQLPRLVQLTTGLGMTPVVEVHAAPDVKRALRAGADVILINNRDMNSLKVNMQTVDRLAKMVPRDNLVIAASGYQKPAEVAAIASNRVCCVLIGRSLISHKKPEQFLQEIISDAEKL